MSLTSLFLGLVLFPIKPILPQKTKRELELEAELERATFALNHWRTSWHALWAENEQLRAERATLSRHQVPQLSQQSLLDQYRTSMVRTNCTPARASFIAPNNPNLTS
jgi:hypothetical protein